MDRAAQHRQRSAVPGPRPPATGCSGRQHAAAVVGSDEEILASAVPFLEEGLSAGDTAVLACPSGTAELIRAGLGATAGAVEHVPDICLLDTRSPDAVAATQQLLDRARRTGSGRARLVGQVQFGAEPRTWREGQRYEAASNVLLAGQPLDALCLYDSRHLPAELLDGARATHPHVVADGAVRASPDYEDPRDFVRRLPLPRAPVEDTDPVLSVVESPGLADLRHRVGDALDRHVPDADLAGDLLLAVSEMAANAFRHGVPPVSARIWVGSGLVIRTGSDPGAEFADPLSGVQPAHGPDLGRGGMGLWLARKLCDHVDLLPGPEGLTVRLATRLP